MSATKAGARCETLVAEALVADADTSFFIATLAEVDTAVTAHEALVTFAPPVFCAFPVIIACGFLRAADDAAFLTSPASCTDTGVVL